VKSQYTLLTRALDLIFLVGLGSLFFIPIMIASAPSIGCRFQDGRLQAIMPPTPQGLLCVLPWGEVAAIVLNLVLSVFFLILDFRSRFELEVLRGVAFGLLLYPFLDLTYVGLQQERLQYGLEYQFAIGYWIYLVLVVLAGVSGYLKFSWMKAGEEQEN